MIKFPMVGALALPYDIENNALREGAGDNNHIDSSRKLTGAPEPDSTRHPKKLHCRCRESCLRPTGPRRECRTHLLSIRNATIDLPPAVTLPIKAIKPSISVPIPDFFDRHKFWSKVDKRGPDECWPWTAAKSPKGYGRFKIERRLYSSHRITWALANGPIPAGDGYHGSVIMHSCDNPCCCNPNHLSCGTNKDNAKDMAAKGRNYMPNGQPRPSGHSVGNGRIRSILGMKEPTP